MGIALALVALQANDGNPEQAIVWLHDRWRSQPDQHEVVQRALACALLRSAYTRPEMA